MSSIGGGVTGIAIGYIVKDRRVYITYLINGILGALVAITAICALARPWESVVIGSVGAATACAGEKLMVRLNIDDPVNAVAIHAFASVWGLLAVGIFGKKDTIEFQFSDRHGLISGGGVYLMGVQILAILSLVTWTVVTSYLLLKIIDVVVGLRCSAREESLGADLVHHGIGGDYPIRHCCRLPTNPPWINDNPPSSIVDSDGCFIDFTELSLATERSKRNGNLLSVDVSSKQSQNPHTNLPRSLHISPKTERSGKCDTDTHKNMLFNRLKLLRHVTQNRSYTHGNALRNGYNIVPGRLQRHANRELSPNSHHTQTGVLPSSHHTPNGVLPNSHHIQNGVLSNSDHSSHADVTVNAFHTHSDTSSNISHTSSPVDASPKRRHISQIDRSTMLRHIPQINTMSNRRYMPQNDVLSNSHQTPRIDSAIQHKMPQINFLPNQIHTDLPLNQRHKENNLSPSSRHTHTSAPGKKPDRTTATNSCIKSNMTPNQNNTSDTLHLPRHVFATHPRYLRQTPQKDVVVNQRHTSVDISKASTKSEDTNMPLRRRQSPLTNPHAITEPTTKLIRFVTTPTDDKQPTTFTKPSVKLNSTQSLKVKRTAKRVIPNAGQSHDSLATRVLCPGNRYIPLATEGTCRDNEENGRYSLVANIRTEKYSFSTDDTCHRNADNMQHSLAAGDTCRIKADIGQRPLVVDIGQCSLASDMCRGESDNKQCALPSVDKLSSKADIGQRPLVADDTCRIKADIGHRSLVADDTFRIKADIGQRSLVADDTCRNKADIGQRSLVADDTCRNKADIGQRPLVADIGQCSLVACDTRRTKADIGQCSLVADIGQRSLVADDTFRTKADIGQRSLVADDTCRSKADNGLNLLAADDPRRSTADIEQHALAADIRKERKWRNSVAAEETYRNSSIAIVPPFRHNETIVDVDGRNRVMSITNNHVIAPQRNNSV